MPDRIEIQTVVLQSFKRPTGTTNPYLHQLLDNAAPNVANVAFTWRFAMTGSYDVFHVHWPEVLLRGSDRRHSAARQALATLFLIRLALTRRPVVRTWHNATPHEVGGWYERQLLRWLTALTRHVIWLNPVDARADQVGTIVLHGDYVDWFAGRRRQAPTTGRVVCVGLIRPYKGIEGLLNAFRRADADGISLRVAGRCDDAQLRAALVALTAGDARVSLALQHLDDGDLVDEVTGAQLVVLPYRALQNSGAALLALSLNRPVLVPDNAYTRALGAEVGEAWVQRFEPPLDATALVAALQNTARALAGPAPDLSRRRWTAAGRAHAVAYQAALQSMRGRTSEPDLA